MSEVTVLMTTYNEKVSVLEEAIESILNQTFQDIELLVVVDNPQNKLIIERLDEYSKEDYRIRYVVNKNNMGLPGALNRGIELVESEYIARMDADDIALPERLEKQVGFLRKNPEVDLVGSNVVYMDENGVDLRARGGIPCNPDVIRRILKCMNVMNHPTFVGKTEVFKTYKYRLLQYSQDYDFICRLVEGGCKVANVSEPLIRYRVLANVNKDKKIKQKITQYCVQRLYKKNILQKSDVVSYIETETKKINQEQFLAGIECREKFIDALRRQKIPEALDYLNQCIWKSKYSRSDLVNLFTFLIYKLIYKF